MKERQNLLQVFRQACNKVMILLRNEMQNCYDVLQTEKQRYDEFINLKGICEQVINRNLIKRKKLSTFDYCGLEIDKMRLIVCFILVHWFICYPLHDGDPFYLVVMINGSLPSYICGPKQPPR